MQQLSPDLSYSIYVLLFGVYVSLRIACGPMTSRRWTHFSLLSPALLLIQGLVLHLGGATAVRFLYPLITHLPLALALVVLAHVRWDAALISVAISYSLCQLLRWAGLIIGLLPLSGSAFVVIHLCCCQLILAALDRFCLSAVHDVIADVPRLIVRFGALPLVYYLYEYAVLLSRNRYAHIPAFSELLPTGLVLFFILFVIAYHRSMKQREQLERQAAALEMQLSQAEQEMTILRAIEEQTAIYRHDLHHHLMMIDSLIASDKSAQATQYIQKARAEIDAIAAERLCENETVNLLLGAFKARSRENGVDLTVRADLPALLNLPDTELCALLSNGLENALHAAVRLPEGARRAIHFSCRIRQGSLLLEIRNPYAGEVRMEDGLPVSPQPGHHFGCRSIRSIALRRKGVCTFDASDGIFTLRCAIPLTEPDSP